MAPWTTGRGRRRVAIGRRRSAGSRRRRWRRCAAGKVYSPVYCAAPAGGMSNSGASARRGYCFSKIPNIVCQDGVNAKRTQNSGNPASFAIVSWLTSPASTFGRRASIAQLGSIIASASSTPLWSDSVVIAAFASGGTTIWSINSLTSACVSARACGVSSRCISSLQTTNRAISGDRRVLYRIQALRWWLIEFRGLSMNSQQEPCRIAGLISTA